MEFLQLLVASLMPVGVSLAMQGLKYLSERVESLSPILKQVVTLVLAAGATWLASVSGQPLPTDVLGWPGDVVSTVLTWLAALGLHGLKKTTIG